MSYSAGVFRSCEDRSDLLFFVSFASITTFSTYWREPAKTLNLPMIAGITGMADEPLRIDGEDLDAFGKELEARGTIWPGLCQMTRGCLSTSWAERSRARWCCPYSTAFPT